jgi:hypothetical protein
MLRLSAIASLKASNEPTAAQRASGPASSFGSTATAGSRSAAVVGLAWGGIGFAPRALGGGLFAARVSETIGWDLPDWRNEPDGP